MQQKTVFVIRNQFDQYLGKHSDWLSGRAPQQVYRAGHHDEALNTLIEINAKDITLRGNILETGLDEKKNPMLEVSEAALALEKDLAQMEKAQPSEWDEA